MADESFPFEADEASPFFSAEKDASDIIDVAGALLKCDLADGVLGVAEANISSSLEGGGWAKVLFLKGRLDKVEL